MTTPWQDRPLPREVIVGGFKLTVLTVDDVEEDFVAVTESVGYLKGALGGTWPAELSLRQNLADLGWHEVEFEMNRSFAWVIRTMDGAYAGCAYLRAAFNDHSHIKAAYWFRASYTDKLAIEAFDVAWVSWITEICAPVTPSFSRRSIHHPAG